MPPFRDTVDPSAERGSLHGGQPTLLPQTSQPPATKLYLHTHSHITQTCTNTELFLLCITALSLCLTLPTSLFSVSVAVWRSYNLGPRSTQHESFPSQTIPLLSPSLSSQRLAFREFLRDQTSDFLNLKNVSLLHIIPLLSMTSSAAAVANGQF